MEDAISCKNFVKITIMQRCSHIVLFFGNVIFIASPTHIPKYF